MQEKTRLKLKIISSFAMCVLSLFAMVSLTLSWFAVNDRVDGNGMSVATQNDQELLGYEYYRLKKGDGGYALTQTDAAYGTLGVYDALSDDHALVVKLYFKRDEQKTTVKLSARTETRYFLGDNGKTVGSQTLKNSEFHLFYQPKYNLRQKTLDGCEILVRWYDPELEKYHLPSEFLPVFEENGFIAKLDRFVFFKACENLAQRAAERHICYPISVNVSRVTAIQPDFVDYYVRIKNKFNIKDDFITLEFSESFAYENYEFLKRVVNRLHENGLLCSIDDFGTGYSSYNILKTIETDEIKLDKFFLGKGFSAERDRIVLESVIEMVRKLGIKVTQEGVETKEDMFRLEELGCDVMQGYYFAKPMKYFDYCSFIDDNFV